MTSGARGPQRDFVVIGGSAGAMPALSELLTNVSSQLRSVVLVSLHMSPHHDSRLAELLGAHSKLPVAPAAHGVTPRPGHVYVSVPDHHLQLDGNQLHLGRGAKEHFTRPAIDVLFRAAARRYGPRVVGVLLSGGGGDGALGLLAIRGAGGVALVQDPKTATHKGMLISAVDKVQPDAVLSVRNIARALDRLAAGEPMDTIEG